MLDVLNREVPPAEQERLTAEKTPGAKSLQVVLVFQGGGALGAYQAGVYQALHETHVEPDWIIGTSIGAINASLIAGNEPENRIDRLEEFWRRMRRQEFWRFAAWPGLSDTTAYWSTLLGGIPGFFEPNPWAWGDGARGGLVQFRPRVHVRIGLHPIAKLPYGSLPNRHRHARPLTATRAGRTG